MLKLVNIVKDYQMKDQEPVHALKGLTINFRRSEFVAILGPSGCGKTTLLNIIGGLDRYTSGDLIIEGKSTKDYKDGDWDTYRNHSIGFVFQAYNLIAHQSVIRNVELALTISGIDKEERRERALKALEKVGLKGLERKKPNQLSGGQMQRVAIARALINEPEILLADEPTGALDSETSIQIMDLLKEVAKDCLVIMVTHNPDLANAYANRIVMMKDGLYLSDSNPYSDEEEKVDHVAHIKRGVEKSNKGNKKKSSMSFMTATGLSMSNLFSKLKRTVLIAIAGSIGIIGVSAVLAVSNGVHNYIDEMQNDMISQYPLSIEETAVDYMSLLSGLSNDEKRTIVEFAKDKEVGLDSLINYLMDKYKDFTQVKTNDINDDLIEYVESMPKEYVSSINKNYGIDVTNNIFTDWKRDATEEEQMISLNGLTQMYISELETVDGFSEYAVFVDLFTDFMEEIPGEEDYILEQYDIIAGEYPKGASDIVLVVDENQTLTDLIYAQMGFFSETEFINIAKKAIKDHEEGITPEELAKYDYPTSYTFEQILGKKLKYFPHDSIYNWETISSDVISIKTSMKMDDQNYDLTFKFKYDDVTESLQGTVTVEGYTSLHANFFRTDEEGKDPNNPFKGNWKGKFSTVMGSMELNFTIDDTNVTLHIDSPSTFEETVVDSVTHVKFTIPSSGSTPEVQMDLSYNDDKLTGVVGGFLPVTFTRASGTADPTHPVLGEWSGNIMGQTLRFTLGEDNVLTYHVDRPIAYTSSVDNVTAYMYNATVEPTWEKGMDMRISAVLKKKEGVNFGCLSRGVYHTRAFTQKMLEDSINSKIVAGEHSIEEHIRQEEDTAYQAYVKYKFTSYVKGEDHAVKNVSGYASALNTDFSSSLGSMLSIRGTSTTSVNKAYLRSLSGLATKEVSIEGATAFDFKPLPKSISIYPKDFTKKSDVTDYLKKWNEEIDLTLPSGKVLHYDDRQELNYTDTVEIIVNVINTLINVVTIALISFTSLALVVSCFMIAVITYISTMERVKEIGIIRSLGGRKKDVSRLFVAECLIIGLSSGLIGIGITYILQLIVNIIVSSLNVGITMIAALPIYTAGIMIAISIFLNVMSGLIPAMKASNQDPVAALRSE